MTNISYWRCLAFSQTSVFTLLAALLSASSQLSARADAVTDWNAAALNAIRATRANPPVASRALAITHLAIHDAVQGIERTHRSYFTTGQAPAGASVDAAVAAAGYTTLRALFPNADVDSTNFQAVYTAQLNAIPDGRSKSDGLAWGQLTGQALLDARAGDGWNTAANYAPSGSAGHWKPTGPANAPALLPGWGSVRPFVLTRGSQFRPPPPPRIDSTAHSLELNTVKAYGGTISAVRSSNQTEVALFWNDGPGTATPPGHWNLIARGVSSQESLSLAENARLFALLNMALADAAIACWDAKFAYDTWRPVTAIREADTDNNRETERDTEWTSLIPTPPFPEYTSGHSTFSRSAATVLAGFFGTDAIAFTTTTDGLPGVTRSFPGFSAAADEAGTSRLYGGIHFPSGNIHAQGCGFLIGQQTLNYFLQPLNTLQFAGIHRAEGRTELEFEGEPNRNYVIRATSDLKTWETIATLASSDGVIRFTDVNAAGQQLRFYDIAAQ
jgi:hypothetical protein